ncbi:MAG: ribosome biogenesis GTPase Der [Candidatus Brocadiales bacterium]
MKLQKRLVGKSLFLPLMPGYNMGVITEDIESSKMSDKEGLEQVAAQTGLPVVAIVGRPNVGKSSIFNRLVKRRIAIVDPTSGVTRDRVSAELSHGGKRFELVDTGGIGIQDVEEMAHHVEEQIEAALEKASIIVFVVDVRDGIVPLDKVAAERLRHVNKPVLLVANKVDDPSLITLKAEFFKLGFGEPLAFSAQQGFGRAELLEEIVALVPFGTTALEEPQMQLAVVGRRNVGKSTLINTLAQEERMIVSEIPGTTRDSVDVRFELNGKVFVAIDTAGVRKKRQVEGSVEFYGLSRAKSSVRRASVVLFLLDATEEISQVDKRLGAYIAEQFRPCIIVVNKWDLAVDTDTEEFVRYVRYCLPGLSYAPVSFISARNAENVVDTVGLAEELYRQAGTRVSTSELNKVIGDAVAERPTKRKRGRAAKIFFATQVTVAPPTFVLFVNQPSFFDASYERYLANRLRDKFSFSEVPLRFFFRERRR